jgi:hypothetical protein
VAVKLTVALASSVALFCASSMGRRSSSTECRSADISDTRWDSIEGLSQAGVTWFACGCTHHPALSCRSTMQNWWTISGRPNARLRRADKQDAPV